MRVNEQGMGSRADAAIRYRGTVHFSANFLSREI